MKRLDPLIALIIAVASWQAIIWLTDVPRFILPSPARVAQTAYDNRMLIAEHAWTTGLVVVAGLILATLLGIGTAIQLAFSPLLRRRILPILVFTQSVPIFALAPILMLWFGYGITPKILTAVLITYFPVTSAFYDGLSRVNPGYLDLAQTMGASSKQIMWRIRIPNALPSLGTGLRLSAVYAPFGAVVAEWVGSSQGLGFLMLLANGRAKTDLMFATVITLALFTVLLHRIVNLLANRLSSYSSGDSK